MPPVISQSILALEDNPKDVYLEVSRILLMLTSNIIEQPRNPKFRALRLNNSVVLHKLLPAVGAMECLFEMGFQEGEDILVLPENASLDLLKRYRDEIHSRRAAKLNETSTVPTPSTSTPSTTSESKKADTQPEKKTTSATDKTASQIPRRSSFLERIATTSLRMLRDQDKVLLERARNCIPLMDLEIRMQEKMRLIQKKIKENQSNPETSEKETEPSVQELMILELLSWFKESFFTWVNNPSCSFCKGKTKFKRTDIVDGLRIEMYECAACLRETLFPRYSDPEKLLETRKGRCGEWGRCFTLLCRSLGWEARFVLDETDHVWSEVYSVTQKRWIHCDPCENAFDNPLLYEKGWKKKLTYIIAYSPDDIQDVTWRYTSNHKEVLLRRKSCSESTLVKTLIYLRAQRQQNLSERRKKILTERALVELVELMKEPSAKQGEYQGRQSGSLLWRLQRGEISESTVSQPYIWRPTKAEIDRREIRIQYQSGIDQYTRGPVSEEVPLQGWQNGTKSIENIFRKTEHDWNTVYLARKEGCEKGRLLWHIDLLGTGMIVDSVKLTCATRVFESGQVVVSLCGGDSCVRLMPGECDLKTEQFGGSTSITLSVDLLGGVGNVAWQHAQLFRSEIGSDDVGLDITVLMKAA